jgi:hypothetical protein
MHVTHSPRRGADGPSYEIFANSELVALATKAPDGFRLHPKRKELQHRAFKTMKALKEAVAAEIPAKDRDSHQITMQQAFKTCGHSHTMSWMVGPTLGVAGRVHHPAPDGSRRPLGRVRSPSG